MAATGIGFRWLDILEKEFDKACIELDTSLTEIEVEEAEATFVARQKIAALGSCFAQLSHKAQTIFQNSAKLQAELVDMRAELVEARATVAGYEERGACAPAARGGMEVARARSEAAQFARENAALRDTILSLHADLYSARLAAKYLDKELAGRIQQLQLLGREMRSELRDSLWRQLEAEILLQRHKTVVRACRSGKPCAPAPAADTRGVGRPRLVRVQRDPHQGLGISITGGREHGVPILISELEAGGPAALTRALHVGDAILAVNDIDLTQACHKEAVSALQSATGDCALCVQFVACDDDNDLFTDDNHYRFPLYPDDDEVFAPEANGSGATPTAPRTPEYNRRHSDGVNSGSEYESPPYPEAQYRAPLPPYPDYNAINNNLSILDMDDDSIKIQTQAEPLVIVSPPPSPAMRERAGPRGQRHLGRYRGIAASADLSSNDSQSTPVHTRRPHTKKKKVKPGDWRSKGAYRAIDGGISSDEAEPTPPLDHYVPPVDIVAESTPPMSPPADETPESQLSPPTSDLSPPEQGDAPVACPLSPRLSPPASQLVNAKKADGTNAGRTNDADDDSWKLRNKTFRIGSARRVSDVAPRPLLNGNGGASSRRVSALLSGDGDPDFGTPV